ncbi:MAG: hypothetical protein L0G46_02295 [Kocuria sp.]|nr:hypothetical protein [Kocuria sp.]
MCRACSETPDGQGRHCTRNDGFSEVEGNQRNRSRGLNNAAGALAHGDPQSAVNQLENARRAQRDLDGVPAAPLGVPQEAPGPQRDIQIAPSSIDAARAQLDQLNRARAERGESELGIDITRQNAEDTADPIMTWERGTVRVSGGTQEELDSLRLTGVASEPERRVKTTAVLQATCAITRIDSGGRYLSRNDGGEQSTPARVIQYINEGPGGPLRQQYAPTAPVLARAKSVRTWARETRPTNDYLRAMRHALGEESLGPREVGTAASALCGYERAYAEKSRAEQMQEEFLAKHGMSSSGHATTPEGGSGASAAGVMSDGRPPRSQSRWLNQPGDKVMVTGRVERVRAIVHEKRWDPRHLYIIRTPDGDAVKWLPPDFVGFEEGDEVTLRGQVKAHTEFQGEKQTEMFYCKPEIHPRE